MCFSSSTQQPEKREEKADYKIVPELDAGQINAVVTVSGIQGGFEIFW